MAEREDTSAIERLKEGLYRRTKPSQKEPDTFSEQEFKVPEEWNGGVVAGDKDVRPADPLFSGLSVAPNRLGRFFTMKKLFIASFIFFFCAALFFLFVILRGSNIVSTRNVSILVDGPVGTEAGEPLSLKILVENKNNTALQFADLLIEYPEGTRAAKNPEEELTRFRKSLGTIAPRETVTETVEAVLFGQEGDKKEITITLEYRAEDSNAIFVAEKKYQIHVSASPLALRASLPAEASVRQEFQFEVAISSEASETVEDVLVFVDYPFGFTFESASPEPSFGNDTWFLGDVPKDGKRTITVRGALLGQAGEEKVFRIEGGLADKSSPQKIGVVYGTSLEAVRIVEPSLGASLLLRGADAEEVAIPAGERVEGEVILRNNTSAKITSARATLGFSGEVLEKASVTAPQGFYRSLDNTVIWDKNSYDALSEIAPGATVRLPFSFSAFSALLSSVRVKNPVVLLAVSTEGEYFTAEGVLANVRAESKQTAKVNSDVTFGQRAVYYDGPFGNSGSLPPKVDVETTYTILWSVLNTSNDLQDISVRATLPPYVRWVGQTSPASENITYNPDQRTVLWRAPEIKAWKGVASLPHEVAFQLGVTPSVSQAGQAPEIIRTASFSGTDSFTEAALSAEGLRATTEAGTDSRFKAGDGTVVQ